MANILMRALKAALPLRQIARNYASFTLREILSENSRQTGTFFLRLSKHLALENRLQMAPVPTTIRYADYFPVTEVRQFEKELRRTPAEQLPALFVFAYTYRPSADPNIFAQVLNRLDAYALQMLPQMEDEQVLNTLYSLLFLMPSWITLMDFYRAAIQQLAQHYSSSTELVTKDKFVQFCFYLGLDKRHAANSAQTLHQLLTQHLPEHLPQLSAMDLAIICNASYKAAVVVPNPEFDQRLTQEVLKLGFEASQIELLITFLKTLRLQRHKSQQICDHLTQLCVDAAALQQLSVSALAHIFAVFAEHLWDNEASTQPMINAFLNHLGSEANKTQNYNNNTHNKFRRFTAVGNVRAKDVDKFLWCCAQLNCNLPQATLQRLESVLLQKVSNEEFNAFPDQLVDCCLSLWCLGYRSRQLYEQAEQLKGQSTTKRQQPKVDARLTVLQTAVAIEEPTWLQSRYKLKGAAAMPVNLVEPAPAYLLKNRQDLKAFAEKLSQEAGVKEAKIICPLVGINIPSILVSFEDDKEPQVFVELLTTQQILQISETAVPIVRLKVDLLNALGYKVVSLHENDLEIYTNLKSIISSTEQEEEHTARSI